MDDIATLRRRMREGGPDELERMNKELADEGRLLQAQFEILYGQRLADMPFARDLLRQAFMAGATVMLSGMADGHHHDRLPTSDELRRARKVREELKDWQVRVIMSNPQAVVEALRIINERREGRGQERR